MRVPNFCPLPLTLSRQGDCVAIKKVPYCHAERERSICFSDTLLKADSSPAAQNDIATQSQGREKPPPYIVQQAKYLVG